MDSIEPSKIECFLCSDKFAVPLESSMFCAIFNSPAFFVKVSPFTTNERILVKRPSLISGNFENKYFEMQELSI